MIVLSLKIFCKNYFYFSIQFFVSNCKFLFLTILKICNVFKKATIQNNTLLRVQKWQGLIIIIRKLIPTINLRILHYFFCSAGIQARTVRTASTYATACLAWTAPPARTTWTTTPATAPTATRARTAATTSTGARPTRARTAPPAGRSRTNTSAFALPDGPERFATWRWSAAAMPLWEKVRKILAYLYAMIKTNVVRMVNQKRKNLANIFGWKGEKFQTFEILNIFFLLKNSKFFVTISLFDSLEELKNIPIPNDLKHFCNFVCFLTIYVTKSLFNSLQELHDISGRTLLKSRVDKFLKIGFFKLWIEILKYCICIMLFNSLQEINNICGRTLLNSHIDKFWK